MTTAPTFSERIRSARTILFGKGDDAVVCSFCGKDRHETGDIVTGPGVAICNQCAGIAQNWVFSNSLGAATEGKTFDTFLVLEQAASVIPEARAAIPGELSHCAAELSCDLICWSYFCGNGRMGDGLSVHIQAPATANITILRETFSRMYLSGAGKFA